MTEAAGVITGLYRQRLDAAAIRYALPLAALWRRFSPGDPEGSIGLIGQAAGPLIAVAQAAFTAEALGYLAALTAAAAGSAVADVAPFPRPPQVVGFGQNGAPIGAVTGLAASVYRARVAAGHREAEAADSSRRWLERVAASAPYRAANDSVAYAAGTDDRLTGRVVRIPEPDACAFCKLIADRGYVPVYLPGGQISTRTFPAHAYCRCTASPEISSRVYSQRQQRYAARRQAPAVPAPRTPPPSERLLGPMWRAASASDRDLAERAIDRALGPVPPQIAARFQGVRMATEITEPQLKTARGNFWFGDHHVNIRADLSSAVGEQQVRKGIAQRWYTPTGEATSIQRTIAHEIGHWLHDQVPKRAAGGEINLAAPPPGLSNDSRVTDLVRKLTGINATTGRGRMALSELLSEYGTKDTAEMVAEAWAEYVYSPNPRPVARAIGEWLLENAR